MHSDKEKVLLEAVKNLLDQDNLGLPKSDVEKPGSHTFQFQYENINDLFCIKILKDTSFYDSHNSAFRKVHSYKYLEDPTFEASYASELRSMGIPKSEIELGIETIKKVREEILKGDNEAKEGWASNLDEVIQTTKEGGNKKSAEQNIPFSGIEPDNTRPVPIKVESKDTKKTITENAGESVPYDGNISLMHDIIVDPKQTWEERKRAWDALGVITGDNEEMTEESLKNYINLLT